jgi:metal-responsive CopG/Arc/MetJ family transcriptional regulator
MVVRMPSALIAEIEAWAESKDVGRSEAVRRLIEIGLRRE